VTLQLAFLRQSLAERQLYFEQAAFERRMHPAVLEKDFWVCWFLAIAFGNAELGDHMLFKGGTALSKVFRVIERFSEDLDLGIPPERLGITEEEVEHAASRTQRERWMKRLQDSCAAAVRERFQPVLEQAVVEVLGLRVGGARWLEFVTDRATHSPVLFFHYPTTQAEGFPYLRRAVKLEFGSLTDQRTVGRHPVRVDR
jgi:hypothetical protein